MSHRHRALLLLVIANIVAGIAQVRSLPPLLRTPRAVAKDHVLIGFGSVIHPSTGAPLLMRARVLTRDLMPVPGVQVQFQLHKAVAVGTTDSEGYAVAKVTAHFRGSCHYRFGDLYLTRQGFQEYVTDRFPARARVFRPENPGFRISTPAADIPASQPVKLLLETDAEQVWVDMLDATGRVLDARRVPGRGELQMTPPNGFKGELTFLAYELARDGQHSAVSVRVAPYLDASAPSKSHSVETVVLPKELADLRRQPVPWARELSPETASWVTADRIRRWRDVIPNLAILLYGFTLAAFFAGGAFGASLREAELTEPPAEFGRAVWASVVLILIAALLTTSRTHVWIWLACSFAISAWIFSRLDTPMLLRGTFATLLFLVNWCTMLFLFAMTSVPLARGSDAILTIAGWGWLAPFVWWQLRRPLRRCALTLLVMLIVGANVVGWIWPNLREHFPADYDYYAGAYQEPASGGTPPPGWLTMPDSNEHVIRTSVTDGEDRAILTRPLKNR